ncbi:hypothetical protein A2335_02760 [Candidatus Peregrinibacteria bacterium RIFOXYB2_FULL_32_7]|nr:MAG: hypothetical protein A2335_02760 [Candidatus Peregrinibacteria bacterium RIFOXYB2_FULL_32_7]
MLQTYEQFEVEIVKAKGTYIWDKSGKKYLDFYGGHAVCITGHCNPTIVKAIKKQSDKLIFYSNIFFTEPSFKLGKKLCETLLPEKYQVFFANSGSEANETAIKMARKFTNKNHIISFKKSFHGRSITSLGITGIDSYHQFEPNLDQYTSFAEFGNLDSVKELCNANIAAIICEAIQSIGGINEVDFEFYKKLREFCDENNILLIFDEVQTGLGRTGTFWYCEQIGIYPDIITSAKGIAGGLPISAVLLKEKISRTIKTGEHATTFGGGPLVCSAGYANINYILRKNFLKKVKQKSFYLIKKLKEINQIDQVLGKGFLIGIKFKEVKLNFVKLCLEKGLILGPSYKKDVFRLMPPLTVTFGEIDQFIKILKSVLI